MLVANFDCHFERVLQEMEDKAREQKQRAIKVTTWACINMTALCQRNAKALQKQWIKGGQKLEKMEENDILKLIRKMGGFDTTNVDSESNSDRMVQMQDNAAERDVHYKKKHRHQYG